MSTESFNKGLSFKYEDLTDKAKKDLFCQNADLTDYLPISREEAERLNLWHVVDADVDRLAWVIANDYKAATSVKKCKDASKQ